LPSARKRPPEGQLLPIYRETIFVDRSLGASIVPNALRAKGLTVVTMREHYGEVAGARTADVEWIADVGDRGWIAFHKDDNIRRKAEEIAAVDAHSLRMFVITNASLTGDAMAQRYLDNLARISRAARRPGPFIYGVYDDELKRLHP
jgi:hypothetical protein